MFNLEEMKGALEKPTCPVHHEKAQVTINSRALVIKTCCKKFELMMDVKHEQEIARQADKKLKSFK